MIYVRKREFGPSKWHGQANVAERKPKLVRIPAMRSTFEKSEDAEMLKTILCPKQNEDKTFYPRTQIGET